MLLNKLATLNQKKGTVFMDERADMQEDKEKTINAMVHEIRNPLAAIKLTNQMMQEAYEKGERDELLMHSYMEIIGNNIQRIQDHLTAVLTYRKREITLAPVNICDCIDKAVFLAKDRLFLGGITVANNCRGGHWVYGNEERLITVFLNIVINAIEAIKADNGRIWISVYETNNTVRVTFKDNGAGMEQSTIEKIFDAGFSTKDGIGIGLYNVKEIMNLHKANIVADSLPGIGTSISILFSSIPGEELASIEAGKRIRTRDH